MSTLDNDLPWLTAEAGNDPETAQQIIAALAERVQSLQRQSDELRAENALLKRTGGQQGSAEQVQRLKTNLRDLRQLAARKGLDRDIVSLVAFTGNGVQLPAPAPLEQTLVLNTAPEEPISLFKPIYLAAGRRFDSLLAITSALRLSLVNGLGVPISESYDWRDARPMAGLGLARAERIEAVHSLDELRPPHDLLLVTRQGWLRVMSWSHVETLSLSGQAITLPGEGDAPVWLGPVDPAADVLFLTRNGRWTRFPIRLVPSTGCAGVTLETGDDVVGAAVLGNDESVVLFCSADGNVFAVESGGLEAHKKPGAKAQPLARRFMGLACYGIANRKNDLMFLLSNQGDIHVVNLMGLPVAPRLSEVQSLKVSGQRLIAATLIR